MKRFAFFLALSLTALIALAQSELPTVEETIAALEGGIAEIPVEAAVANIEGWQAQLEGSDDAALQDIAAQLGELSAALQAETIDSAEVSGLLTSLGEATTAAAEGAGDDQLATLGNLLSEAGAMVMGGDMSGGMTGGTMSGGSM